VDSLKRSAGSMGALDALEKVALPEGSAGPWSVERFIVPTVRKGRPPFWRELPVGTYTRLRHRGPRRSSHKLARPRV